MRVRINFTAFVIISISAMLCTSMAAAEPILSSVSGTISNGGTVQINGTLGSMGGAIVSWDDFENHTVGVDLSGRTIKPIIGPTWSTFKLAPATDPVAISATRAHSGGKSVLVDWGSSTINSFGWGGQGPFSRLYITYWRYQEGNFDSSCNHKQFYLYGNRSQFPQNMPLIPAGNTQWGFYNNVSDGSLSYSDRNNLNSLGWTYSSTSGRFQRWEFYTQLNSPYTSSNGIVKAWVDARLGIENYNYRSRTVDGEFVDFRLGHMAQGFTSSARAWFDDLYISTTEARIELGNNSVFENCTHREIQIPISWNSGQIRATINQGAFKAGEKAYLFVVDASGEASAGYPVTIGSGSNPLPDAVGEPRNLSIVSSNPN